jgi:hypothetical protein
MEIEKRYFTVPEVLERWSMSESDLVYLAENDELRLSVRVFEVQLGTGAKAAQADPTATMAEQGRFSGLLDLRAGRVQLFRCSECHLHEFRTPGSAQVRLRAGAPSIFVMIGDLLMRRDERDRFEAACGFSPNAADGAIRASAAYHEVRARGRLFRLGSVQAQVVRVLHEAALAGEPWQNGKAILSAAGSKSLRMSDVFKSQPHWRELIESNGRGAYRLAPS